MEGKKRICAPLFFLFLLLLLFPLSLDSIRLEVTFPLYMCVLFDY
jgi:hypothetical protein